MTDMIQTILRTLVIATIAIAGFALAMVLMVCSAIFVGFLYPSAKITGKPFIGQNLWTRRATWGMPRRPGATPDAPPPSPSPRQPDVIDVEVREIR